jgi:pimeloyl-ACP methyl ester carboxylesterase
MRFALAHMSCAGAWAWGEVPERLRAAGHDVVVPDLPLVAGVTPADHARVIAEAAGAVDGPVVAAGHSYGGLVAPLVADLLGAALVVVVDGFVVDDGESAADVHPERMRGRRAEAAERGDGMWTAGEPDGVEPDWWRRLAPMPLSAFEAPVRLRSPRPPGLFVHCLRSDFASQAQRARERGWEVVEVDAVHVLPLVDPASCAEALLRAGDSVRPPG